MFSTVCKHHLIIYGCLKSTLKIRKEWKNFEKKKIKKKNFFCDNSKLDKTKFLGDFYFHRTMNVPSSIQKWLFATGLLSVVSPTDSEGRSNYSVFLNVSKMYYFSSKSNYLRYFSFLFSKKGPFSLKLDDSILTWP